MPWYLVPYAIRSDDPSVRYPTMDDHTPRILADGGAWSETEVLGNMAIVKVRALAATIAVLDADVRFRKFPLANIDDRMSTLSSAQASALRTAIENLGYSSAEITAALGANIRTGNTLIDVLRFIATRRLKPRWDDVSGTIKVDGPVQVCRPPDAVNGEV